MLENGNSWIAFNMALIDIKMSHIDCTEFSINFWIGGITSPESTQLLIWLCGLGVANQVGEGLTPTISQMLGIGVIE